MADGQEPARAARGRVGEHSEEGLAAERFAEITRFPRRAAWIGGAVAVAATAVNLFVLEHMSGLLFVVMIVPALVCVLATWNAVNFSPKVMSRLQHLAPQLEGHYSLWKAGTGGLTGVPFAHGTEHERFGVLNYTTHDLPVEIGHLSSQVSPQYRAPPVDSIRMSPFAYRSACHI